jgi:hypothetical protein
LLPSLVSLTMDATWRRNRRVCMRGSEVATESLVVGNVSTHISSPPPPLLFLFSGSLMKCLQGIIYIEMGTERKSELCVFVHIKYKLDPHFRWIQQWRILEIQLRTYDLHLSILWDFRWLFVWVLLNLGEKFSFVTTFGSYLWHKASLKESFLQSMIIGLRCVLGHIHFYPLREYKIVILIGTQRDIYFITSNWKMYIYK